MQCWMLKASIHVDFQLMQLLRYVCVYIYGTNLMQHRNCAHVRVQSHAIELTSASKTTRK